MASPLHFKYPPGALVPEYHITVPTGTVTGNASKAGGEPVPVYVNTSPALPGPTAIGSPDAS